MGGIPMSGFDSFLGNEKLIAKLKRDIASGHLSHAYIIEGARGCGKRTLAKLIAAAVSCTADQRPCMECTACRKVAEDKTPDIIMAEPEKAKSQLGVDVIRKLCEEASFAPVDIPKKIFVIPNADDMNMQAQNAFLKTLEEPPPYVMFLILCENCENLLPTIRSRAPVFRVEALSDGIIREKLLSENGEAAKLAQTNPEAFAAAIKLSRGCLGTAILLTDAVESEKCLELYKRAEHFMELLAEKKDTVGELAFHEFALKLAGTKERDRLADIYKLLCDAVRDLINVKLTSVPSPIFYTDAKKASDIADRFPIGRLLRLYDVFTEALQGLDRNANVGLSKLNTAIASSRTK